MLLLLIFPVLVSGFIACHIHPVYQYRLHRYEGQYLYLKSAELGLYCFFLGTAIASALHYWIPHRLQIGSFGVSLALSESISGFMTVIGATPEAESKKMAWFLILSFLMLLSAYILKAGGQLRLYRRFDRWDAKVFVMGELLEDSPLDNLLFHLSLDKEKYAMLTMSDRKVYVGKVVSLGEPSETSGMDQDITIMPIMSGYRNKDNLTIDFTTHYSEIETEVFLSLRQDAIVSATEFDFHAYKIWNRPSL